MRHIMDIGYEICMRHVDIRHGNPRDMRMRHVNLIHAHMKPKCLQQRDMRHLSMRYMYIRHACIRYIDLQKVAMRRTARDMRTWKCGQETRTHDTRGTYETVGHGEA